MQPEPLLAENRRLQRCIGDLVGVVALPAMWAGREPAEIAGSLLDSVLGMLDLDFAHLRLNDADGDLPPEVTRLSPWTGSLAPPEGFGALLMPWTSAEAQEGPRRLTVGGQDFAVLALRLGPTGETGVLVAGSRRADFPLQTEGLLLGVAANQATIGLQAAWRWGEQKRLARELDRRVAARTRELGEANEELRRRELDFQLVVDSIPVPVAVTTPAGEVEGLNRPTLAYFGKTFDELKEWKASDVLHPDDLDGTIAAQRAAHEAGEAYNVQSRHRRFDGVYRWFNVLGVPLRDPQGRILRWFHLIVDIDDQKRAEEQLRASEWNLRRLTETIPQMLWSAKPDGECDYCNARLLDFSGFTAEEIMGGGWRNLFHPDDLDQAMRAWSASAATGAPYQVEARLFHAADSSYRWCLTTALPLRDEEGRILEWHGVCVDMHDWKQAQDELRESQAELARATRVMTMGQLTASIAHELNQPLAGIMTNAGTALRMLTAEPPNIDGARETARRTIRDARRASEVIARLRALFARRTTAAELVDLNTATQEVIALSLNELQRNGVSPRLHLAGNLPDVMGDRVQLQQVILNFILNGTEAMNGVTDRPRELIVSTGIEEGGHVRLAVRDAGTGFDPAMAEKLFSPFYTTKSNGMGIGLSVSRTIVENHHGRLWGERNDGPGSTFCFSIPSRLTGA